jgi:hypothetical protein
MKEFKSLSKQFNKLGFLTKVVILVVSACVFYMYVHKPRILGYSFQNSLTVHEGFVPTDHKITFYKMPSCPHCKEFEFGSKTATSGDGPWKQFANANPGITRVVSTDTTDPAEKEELKGIKGYPTILLTDGNGNKVKEIPRDKFPNDVQALF